MLAPPCALLVPAALALVLATSGCGGTSPSATTGPASAPATAPIATAPDATQPPRDATQPGTGPVTTTGGATTQRSSKHRSAPGGSPSAPSSGGGAKGGSEPVRTPAVFTIKGGKLVPPGVTVPPFIAIQVTVVSGDGRAHKVLFATPPSLHTLAVGPNGRATLRLSGMRAGTYGITLDGRVAGGLVVGGDGGP